MRLEDKRIVIFFVTRMGMYITLVDEKNVVSFVHGYELGTNHACDLSAGISKLLDEKYRIPESNYGWPRQVAQLAKKWGQTWVTTFKKVALEIVTAEGEGGLEDALEEILKPKILTLIERIDGNGHPWFNEHWTEEWLSLCAVESRWFKRLWTDKEWRVLKRIDELVQAGKVFGVEDQRLPSGELMVLKGEFEGDRDNLRKL